MTGYNAIIMWIGVILISAGFGAYGEKLSFLQVQPEMHVINMVPTRGNYVFSAFGYSVKLPVELKSEFIDDELGKGVIVPNKYTFIVNKPRENPLLFLQNVKVGNIGGHIKNLRQLNAELSMNYQDNFDFISQSFYSTPSYNYIFSSIEESTVLLYQQTTKWYRIMGDNNAERILYMETKSCKVFQVGDPELRPIVELWVYPNPETELEITISVKNGSLKQNDIDEIVYSFGLSEAAK